MQKADTLINKFEKASLVTVLVILAIRVWLGPESNFILLVATTILSTYYLWFGFFIFNKLKPQDLLNKTVVRSIKPFRVYVSIIMGIVVSYALIAILAGFFFYPVMHTILLSALLALVAFTGFLAVYQLIKKIKPDYFSRFYYRAAIYAFLLALLYVPPLEQRLEVLFRHHPDFIEAYLDCHNNPDDEEAREKLREQRSRFR